MTRDLIWLLLNGDDSIVEKFKALGRFWDEFFYSNKDIFSPSLTENLTEAFQFIKQAIFNKESEILFAAEIFGLSALIHLNGGPDDDDPNDLPNLVAVALLNCKEMSAFHSADAIRDLLMNLNPGVQEALSAFEAKHS